MNRPSVAAAPSTSTVFPAPAGMNRSETRSSMQEIRVFPAPAGMNHVPALVRVFQSSIPRTRGDEPSLEVSWRESSLVFPAPAGMNQDTPYPEFTRTFVFPAPAGMNRKLITIRPSREGCIPRTRGDEPLRKVQPIA